MPLVHDASSLCNDGQLEAASLEELYSPDFKLLSLTAGAVEKLNLGGIPDQRGLRADPFHEQRARFFEAPLDRLICPDLVLEIARGNRNNALTGSKAAKNGCSFTIRSSPSIALLLLALGRPDGGSLFGNVDAYGAPGDAAAAADAA